MLKAKDELRYERGFDKLKVYVKARAKITKISPAGALTAEWTTDEERHTAEFETLSKIEHSILDSDGRVPRDKRPNGNSWKVFKVYRNNQLLGRIWGLRMELFNSRDEAASKV
jgi:hypothetical protein